MYLLVATIIPLVAIANTARAMVANSGTIRVPVISITEVPLSKPTINVLACALVLISFPTTYWPSSNTAKLSSTFPCFWESITFRGSSIVNFPSEVDETLTIRVILSFSAERPASLPPVIWYLMGYVLLPSLRSILLLLAIEKDWWCNSLFTPVALCA